MKKERYYCTVCGKPLGECLCKDIDERLFRIRQDCIEGFPICSKCFKHYERCRCPDPKPRLIMSSDS